jgi:hypothetical protein
VGAFTVGREGITWACARCGTVNPLESNHCSVCGATFAEVVRPPSKQLERDPNTTLMISLFFPGAGHAYLNLWPEAVARGLISVWAIGVTIVAALGHTGAATVLAVLFGLAAFALWVVDAHDAFRVARHEDRQVILKGRMYLYVVLGLLLVLLAGVVVVSLHNGSSLR